MVGRAGGADAAASRGALAALLRRYLPPMKAYLVRKRRVAELDADDLLQGFVAEKVLDGRFVAAADRGRGRFRSFLLTSLDHFLIDQARRRRPVVEVGPDAVPEPAAEQVPDSFDVEWARAVIDEALRRMEAQCRDGARGDVWAMFQARVVGPTLQGLPPPPYEQLVASLGLSSPSQASNCLVTAKRMYARALREVVTEYAGEGANVEAELRDLMSILSGGRARPG
jgi:RNA polymerase sigma-70 factor (ECF subfamily)